MVNFNDIMETITMIQEENLDIRTITMGISLLDCADSDIDRACEKVYNKIYTKAKDLVATEEIRYSDRQQAHQRHADRYAGRRQRRRSGQIRQNA